MNPKHYLARHGKHTRVLRGTYLPPAGASRAHRRAVALVLETLEAAPTEEVLEVGAGSGELLMRIAQTLTDGHISGIDSLPETVEQLRALCGRRGLAHKVSLEVGPVTALPFAAARFDCACSLHGIYFWPDLAPALAELARVLRPGGRVVLGYSSAEVLRDGGWVERGFRAYSNAQIVEALGAQGLEPEALRESERPGGGLIYACLARKAQRESR